MFDLQHGDAILLRTRSHRFLNTDNGVGPGVKMTRIDNRSPEVSDEMWWIERLSGAGVLRHGDAILLRTRSARFLNTDNGTGPSVKMTGNNNRNPTVSDEIWWVERLAGVGAVQHNDAILLKTRANRFLNTDNGVGPAVKVTANNNRNPAISDEIWWPEWASVGNNFTFDNLISAVQRATLLEWHRFAFGRILPSGNLIDAEKVALSGAFRRPIDHGIETRPRVNASASVGGNQIWINFGLLFPQGQIAIAQTLIHEMMHCAGYRHPPRRDPPMGMNCSAPDPLIFDCPFDNGQYYGTPPLRAELVIAGNQIDMARVGEKAARDSCTIDSSGVASIRIT